MPIPAKDPEPALRKSRRKRRSARSHSWRGRFLEICPNAGPWLEGRRCTSQVSSAPGAPPPCHPGALQGQPHWRSLDAAPMGDFVDRRHRESGEAASLPVAVLFWQAVGSDTSLILKSHCSLHCTQDRCFPPCCRSTASPRIGSALSQKQSSSPFGDFRGGRHA